MLNGSTVFVLIRYTLCMIKGIHFTPGPALSLYDICSNVSETHIIKKSSDVNQIVTMVIMVASAVKSEIARTF